MRAHRLSYETAGTRAAATAQAPAPARATAGPPAPTGYGHSRAQARQRRGIVASLLLVHGLAILGLLNASRLRAAAADARPIFVAVVEAPAPLAPSRPLPAPATRAPPPPALALPPIATEQAAAPPPVVASPLPPAPSPAPVASADAPPAPSIVPKTIPPSAVQYLIPPAPVYARISARMRESGKAVVRVWIDESGLPRDAQLAQSTGFSRLDDAALTAVRNCRFRPYLENGVAVAGWAAIPIEFELPT
jgi:protein TonB